jgi:hypothetical protein
MAKSIYQPPRQSTIGQIIDSVVILGAVFLALWLPIYYELAGADTKEILPPGVTHTIAQDAEGKDVHTWTGLTWEALGQNQTMQAQWEKLGYTIEDAAGLITVWFDYEINWLLALVSAILVVGYFAILLYYSEREYKEVIAEKFDNK